jgi:hypothetical protein
MPTFISGLFSSSKINDTAIENSETKEDKQATSIVVSLSSSFDAAAPSSLLSLSHTTPSLPPSMPSPDNVLPPQDGSYNETEDAYEEDETRELQPLLEGIGLRNRRRGATNL